MSSVLSYANPFGFERLRDQLQQAPLPQLWGLYRWVMNPHLQLEAPLEGQGRALLDCAHPIVDRATSSEEGDLLRERVSLMASRILFNRDLQEWVGEVRGEEAEYSQRRNLARRLEEQVAPQQLEQLTYLKLNVWEHDLQLPQRLITSLPSCIGLLRGLTELHIGWWSHLSSLPENLDGCAALSTLSINDCPQLDKLPDCIGRLSQLKTLSIIHCATRFTLPGSFAQLCNLTNLTLTADTVEGMPPITAFPDLKKLSLNWDMISGDLDRLTKLEVLHFYDGVTEAILPASLIKLILNRFAQQHPFRIVFPWGRRTILDAIPHPDTPVAYPIPSDKKGAVTLAEQFFRSILRNEMSSRLYAIIAEAIVQPEVLTWREAIPSLSCEHALIGNAIQWVAEDFPELQGTEPRQIPEEVNPPLLYLMLSGVLLLDTGCRIHLMQRALEAAKPQIEENEIAFQTPPTSPRQEFLRPRSMSYAGYLAL